MRAGKIRIWWVMCLLSALSLFAALSPASAAVRPRALSTPSNVIVVAAQSMAAPVACMSCADKPDPAHSPSPLQNSGRKQGSSTLIGQTDCISLPHFPSSFVPPVICLLTQPIAEFSIPTAPTRFRYNLRAPPQL